MADSDFNAIMILVRLLEPQVYFVREDGDGPIKIGHAKTVLFRLVSLQTGNPRALRVIATMNGPRKMESAIRRRFNHLRMRGEWFHADKELLNFIHAEADEWPPYDQEVSKKACDLVSDFWKKAKEAGITLVEYVRRTFEEAQKRIENRAQPPSP
jgi:hypothetical protein